MALRIAVTRALPEAQATAERIRALGGEAIVAPLLTIAPRAFNTDASGAQALIFTSINGVLAFAAESSERKLKIFCVGDASADAARRAGFQDVASANGDVAALAALIRAAATPAAGPLIHIGGAHVAGDLARLLAPDGMTVDRRVAYEAVAAQSLPPALNQPLDIIAFHSARAAQTFLALGAPNAAHLTAACLSPAVAARAAGPPWRTIVVAPAPREDALLIAMGLG
jgi:uroporphyrinogen-III synthase